MIRNIGMLMVARTAFDGYYRSLTLDMPTSDLSSFPVLFSGTYDYLKSEANGGKVINSNGYDITFYSDSSLSTLLDFERVYWDAATGTVEFWIRVPTLSSSSNTVIYLAYGNPAIVTDKQNATGVWDTNYQAVYHLPDGTTLTSNDSTGVNNASSGGTPAATAGKIDGGVDFGAGDYLTAGNVMDRDLADAWSMSFWINSTSSASANILSKQQNAGSFIGHGIGYSVANQVQVFIYNGTGIVVNFPSDYINTFTYIVVTYSGSGVASGVIGYVNGSAVSLTTALDNAAGTFTNASDFQLNGRGGANNLFPGKLDEVRVSNSVRAAAWIAAEYSNQNDPANFYTIGSETPA